MSNHTLISLLDALWQQYIGRVAYARSYIDLIEKAGGNVLNDHIAFRTFNTNTGDQPAGIEALARVFGQLGYAEAGQYEFPVKQLTAKHYEHSDPMQPKIFISQLEVEQLPDAAQAMIQQSVADASDALPTDFTDTDALAAYFSRPWSAPKREVIEAINAHSQYAAWTLLHGNAVNHFTAFVNHQNTPEYPDLPSIVEALKAAGVPMKDVIEGEAGSKLRQSSTQSVMLKTPVTEADGALGTIDWSYAYYELAERGNIVDDAGHEKQFSGFLGEQATHLFEMTKTQ